jgi:hypothetical protein
MVSLRAIHKKMKRKTSFANSNLEECHEHMLS